MNWPRAEELPVQVQMPDPTLDRYGNKITSLNEWNEHRAYLKELFAHYLYGHYPEERGPVAVELTERKTIYGGKATEERLSLTFGKAASVTMRVRYLCPNRDGERFPLIVTSTDYMDEPLPLEEKALTEYGYALAAFERCDLCGDRTSLQMVLDYRNGCLKATDPRVIASVKKAERTAPAVIDFDHLHPLAKAYPECDWGEIAQWGFGYLITADALLQRPEIDADRLCYTGHSRMGKSALCAGIYDERAAIVNPNASGCGGVGSLRFLGPRSGLCQDPTACEAVGGITTFAPDWFVPEFASFGDNSVYPEKEQHLPFDANILRASVAPRACFTTEGLDDYWSNPCGTQYAWEDAKPLFELLGIPEKNGIHYRDGGHAHNELDWQALLTYCDFLWFGKPLTEDINKPYFTR